MTNEELAKKLVKYRELEAQKASLADEQDAIKAEISKHMADTKQEKVVADGITAQFIARTKYNFDVKGILAAVPEAIKSLKITNEAFEKLARGGADIASYRKVASTDKTLTIKQEKSDEPATATPTKPSDSVGYER